MELVSIITPVYNSEPFIAETIRSVQQQTYSNWELLLIDDCSTDGSSSLIQKFTNEDSRIRYIALDTNQGAAIARNTGIENANGRYIAFLDSDDRWNCHKLQEQISLMEAKKYSFTFTDYYIVDENTGEQHRFNALKDRVTYSDEVVFNYIACSTVMFDCKITGKMYMPNIRNRQDWGLWISLLKKSGEAIRIDKPLTYYLRRNNSISSNKTRMIKYHWFIYNSFLGFNWLKASWFLFRNVIMHIKNEKKKNT